jgi:hypothetical protein
VARHPDEGASSRAGHTFLTPEELRRALSERSVTDAQLERALAALSGTDPAGLLEPPTPEQVGHVAIYLHARVGPVWVANPAWVLLERGHPAARAIFWHELQELEAYRRLGVQNPLALPPRDSFYWMAHAWGAWGEAQYWAAWAAAETNEIAAAAFLRAHPLRRATVEEVPAILAALQQQWGIDIGTSDVVALRQAEHFYGTKELTRRDVERWLSH